MVTSDKIAQPTDGNKQTELKKKELKEAKLRAEKIKIEQEIKEKALKDDKELKDLREDADIKAVIEDDEEAINLIEDIKKEIGIRVNKEVKKDSNFIEIDWNKVQVIEDIKIILEKLNFAFDTRNFKDDDLIFKYLKDE